MPTETITITETGCYLDNHRGHYITRDAIELAIGYGFIVGPFERFALDHYDGAGHAENYPFESLIELCDDAIVWLNSGQGECGECAGTGKVRDGLANRAHGTDPPIVVCRACSGSRRGPREPGQNFPPIIPGDTYWTFNDGDFGLYVIEDMD